MSWNLVTLGHNFQYVKECTIPKAVHFIKLSCNTRFLGCDNCHSLNCSYPGVVVISGKQVHMQTVEEPFRLACDAALSSCRAILVRLSSLIVLIITLYILIQCTQEEDPESSDDSCSFSPSNALDNLFTSTNDTTGNCPMVCPPWFTLSTHLSLPCPLPHT